MNRPETQRPDDAGFTEPWQAEALALVVALQEAGRISPDDWSVTLSEEIENARSAGDPVDGTTYHIYVLAALERLILAKDLLEVEELRRRHHDWEEAYHRTLHGQPVVLNPGRQQSHEK